MTRVALDTNVLVDLVADFDTLDIDQQRERTTTEQLLDLHGQEVTVVVLDSVRREFLNDTGFDEDKSKYFSYLRSEIGVETQSLNRVPVMIPFALLDKKTWDLIERWKNEGFISDKDGLVVGCAIQARIDSLLTRDAKMIGNQALIRALDKENIAMNIILPSDYKASE